MSSGTLIVAARKLSACCVRFDAPTRALATAGWANTNCNAAAAIGMQVKEVVWTQGKYDVIVISEASDEVKANAFALNTLKLGNVRGQTLRAYTAAEMEKILEHVA